MARTRRRNYPTNPTEEQRDSKYGRRPNSKSGKSAYRDKKGK